MLSFCFGRHAKSYGLFLRDLGISKVMPCDFDNAVIFHAPHKPFAKNMVFIGLDEVIAENAKDGVRLFSDYILRGDLLAGYSNHL